MSVKAAGGSLWIVATPIGTLGDFAPRAVELLAEVDLILSEDTRRARRLLSHVGVAGGARLQSFHEHNERGAVEGLVERIAGGGQVALLSDAGTPALSDPGFLLVRALREHGLAVHSVPGPSAFAAALAASGQPPLPATLVGFLPPRRGPRRHRVAELAALPWTLVILLSPHRLAAEMSDLRDGLGSARPATLLAELSKLHERAVYGSLGELAADSELSSPRGEYVLVVGPGAAPPVAAEMTAAELRRLYEEILDAGLERREALRETARRSGLTRRRVYELVLGRDRS